MQRVGGRGEDAAVRSGERRRGSRSVMLPAVGVLRCYSGTSAAESEISECVESRLMFVNESNEEVGGRNGIVEEEENGGINDAGVPIWESNFRMLGDVIANSFPAPFHVSCLHLIYYI